MHYIITYILFFLGVFFEGELILLSAVIAAHQGLLNIWLVVFIAIIATIASDFFYFNLGKHKAKQWIARSKFADKYKMLQKRLEKNRTKMLLTYRFLYGMRIITPFVLGSQNISNSKFLKYSVASTIIWCFLFVLLGYAFGEIIINNLKHIQKIEYYIIGTFVGIALLFIFIKLFKKNVAR